MFIKLAFFYFCYFAVLGSTIPFWTRYLHHNGFSTTQIGVLLSTMMFTRIFMPYIWGSIADHIRDRIWVIRAATFMALVSFSAIFMIEAQFSYYLMFIFIFTCCWNGILAQFEVIALRYTEQTQLQYGHLRLWGSVGFIVSVFLSGMALERFGADAFPQIVASLLVVMLLSSFAQYYTIEQHKPLAATKTVTLRQLLHNRVIIAILLANLLLQASFAAFNGFYDLYLTQYGYSGTHIGLLIALGVAAEVLLFVYNGKLITRFGAKKILLFSLVLGSIRWVLTAFFPQSVWLMVLVQLFHAFHFGAAHAVSIYLIHRLFPRHYHGRAQALYSSVCFGVGIGAGQLMCGFLWKFEHGGLLSFVISAIFCLIAAGVILKGVRHPLSS